MVQIIILYAITYYYTITKFLILFNNLNISLIVFNL